MAQRDERIVDLLRIGQPAGGLSTVDAERGEVDARPREGHGVPEFLADRERLHVGGDRFIIPTSAYVGRPDVVQRRRLPREVADRSLQRQRLFEQRHRHVGLTDVKALAPRD